MMRNEIHCLLLAYCAFQVCLLSGATNNSEIINELKAIVGSSIDKLTLFKNDFQSDAKGNLQKYQENYLSEMNKDLNYVSNSIQTAVAAISSTGKNAQSCYEECKVNLKNLDKQTNNKLDKCYHSFSYYTEPILKEIKTSIQTTNLEGGSVVEKLNFYNHTECECRDRNEFGAKSEKPSETRFARHHPPLSPQNLRRPPPKKPCRCPSEFLPKISPGGECQCKCSDSDQNCIRARRGKVFFSIRDRLCIHNGDCSTPICEFGEFMSRQGKCPKKQEQFHFYSKYHTNSHHGLRS